VQTIKQAIVSVLVSNPGEHTIDEVFELVRQLKSNLGYDTFRVKLHELCVEGKVKTTGMRHYYHYSV